VSNCNLTQLNQAAFEPILKYFVDNNFTATGSNSASIIIGSSKLHQVTTRGVYSLLSLFSRFQVLSMVKLNLFEIFKLTFNVPIFWARVVVIIVAASQTGIHFLFQ